jgi:Gas vesicle synthesis protein GvpL/GvpF.
MDSQTSNALWYVYGIVSASFSPATLPSGIDDAEVRLERGDEVAALVSVLEGAPYNTRALEMNSGDVEWLSPRAVEHDRVLTWASDLGPVVPLPMFSLFSGREAIQDMLRDREAELVPLLQRLGKGREYALRVYRVDRELMASMTSLSPHLADLEAAAASASPGQRYLLERKLEAEKKNEMRGVSQQIVDDVVRGLGAHAIQSKRVAIAGPDDAAASRGVMILDSAFLVAPDQLEAFQQTLTSIVDRYSANGLRFDFTGPWPPYHFASEADRGA